MPVPFQSLRKRERWDKNIMYLLKNLRKSDRNGSRKDLNTLRHIRSILWLCTEFSLWKDGLPHCREFLARHYKARMGSSATSSVPEFYPLTVALNQIIVIWYCLLPDIRLFVFLSFVCMSVWQWRSFLLSHEVPKGLRGGGGRSLGDHLLRYVSVAVLPTIGNYQFFASIVTPILVWSSSLARRLSSFSLIVSRASLRETLVLCYNQR